MNQSEVRMVEKDCVAVWDSCLEIIRKNVNPQSFRTWFEPIKPVKLEGNVLTIQVPNKFFYEWLEEHFVMVLRRAIKAELGEQGRLEYQILLGEPKPRVSNTGPTRPKVPKPSGKQRTQSADDQIPGVVDTREIKNPFVIPGIRKLKINPQLNPSFTFETFIEGDCNRLARAAGLSVAERPGATSFNPLLIYGDVGLGKTHLAQAIGNKILELYPQKSVLYVTSEKFTNQIIDSIRNNAISDLVNFYQLLDVLIVDDIQFLGGKEKTQEIFFFIFNQLHQARKQIVLTSDRAPKDLPGMEPRLISRFKWGLSADLQPPDFETRMAILGAKMSQEGVDLPNDVVEFICFQIQNNIRELEGVLISLSAQAMLNGRKIDLELAKQVISKFVNQINKEITVDYIQELVADYFNVPVEKLASKTRKRQIVIARQLSMYLAKKLTGKSLKAIGETFGGRDHSTVLYSCRTVKSLMDTDQVFKGKVEDLEKRIRTSLKSTF